MTIVKPNFREKLIVLALVFSPFVSLRFSFFGISELIFILLLIFTWNSSRINFGKEKFIFSKLFFFFLLICAFGTLFSITFISKYEQSINHILFNAGATVMVLISCFVAERSIERKQINPELILRMFFYAMSTAFFILYLISIVKRSIFGMPLFYQGTNRFSPLSDNIHNSALILVLLPYIGMHIYLNARKKIEKILIFFLIPITIYLSLETGASKVYLSLALALFSIIFAYIHKFKKRSITILLFIFGSIFLMSYYNEIQYIMIKIFEENDGESARENLYSVGFKLFTQSPIFGYGSGAYVGLFGEKSDAHNTILSIALQGGVVALMLFLCYLKKIVAVLLNNIFYFATFMSLTSYILFSDILRRPNVWIILLLMYYSIKYTISHDKKI